MKSWSDGRSGVIPVAGLLRLQLLAALLLGSGLAAGLGWKIGISFAFGVLVMLAGGVYLRWRIEQASGLDVEQGRRLLYAAAVQRFAGILILLVLAYAIGLHLLAVAAGIFVAQLMVFVFGLRQAMRDKGE